MAATKLDVTLATADSISQYLASWLLHAAIHPDEVQALVMDDGEAGTVIELRHRDGKGHGGLVYRGANGSAFCLAAVDQSEPLVVKRRTALQMAEACKGAQSRDRYARACVQFVEVLLYSVIPLMIFIALLCALAFLGR